MNQNPYNNGNNTQYGGDPAYNTPNGYPQQGGYQNQYADQQGTYQDQYNDQQYGYQHQYNGQQSEYQDQYADQQYGYQDQYADQQGAYQDQYADQQGAYQDQFADQQLGYQDSYQQPYEEPQPAPPPRKRPQRVWTTEPAVTQTAPAEWTTEPAAAQTAPAEWTTEPATVPAKTAVQEQAASEPVRREPAEIVISARNICKTFGKGETAQIVLDGANLDIEKGSFVSLMGESGTGKSTLLYLIGGLDRNFTGEIYVSGKNIAELSDSKLSEIRCKKMGFVFQFYNLAANLTVEDNILLPIEMSGRKIADYREKYREILEITGLEDKVKSYPSQLSGGQQQRVAIARAVLGDPEILLADEPTGNLDAASGAEIMELFSRLNKERGVTILQVTHSAESASYSNRIVTLKDRIIHG